MPGEKKKYVPDLFRLTDADFKAVGCTAEELEQVKQFNTQLDAINKTFREEWKKDEPTEKYEESRKEKSNLEEQLYTVFLKAAERNPRAWEYAPSNLPVWIQCTGSIPTLDQFLRANGDQLGLIDKIKLLKRRMVSMKAKVNEKEAEKLVDAPEGHVEGIEVISENENAAYLDGLKQNSFQTSGAGCWSASMQLQLQSRGVKNVSQLDIRSFRPNYKASEIKEKIAPDVQQMLDKKAFEKLKNKINPKAQENFDILESDTTNNLMDRGDAFLRMAPDSMLKGVEIAAYDNDIRLMGITREEYRNRAKNIIRKNILHAINEDKAPVSFLSGGHYITVIGIDEHNRIKYKDSYKRGKNSDPDKTYVASLNSFLGKIVSVNTRPLRMEWSAEMKLSQDGKKLYGVPNGYMTVSDDGKVLMPDKVNEEEEITAGYPNCEGHYVRRRYGSDSVDVEKTREETLRNGGIKMTEMVYLPKQLNMNILRSKASKRSPEEEKRLQDMTKSFYNVDMSPGAGYTTLDEINAAYNADDSAFKQGLLDAIASEKENMTHRIESSLAGNPPAPVRATSSTRAYDRYINGLYKNEDITKASTFQCKTYLAKLIAASTLKADGKKFDQKAVEQMSKSILEYTSLGELKLDDMKKFLTNANRIQSADMIREAVKIDIFGVKPKYFEAYKKEMKLLSKNMLTKQGRSREYQNLYDAVKAASEIDLTQGDAAVKIADANKKVIDAVMKYTDGKEKVRTTTSGKDRFDNAIDAMSIVSAFAPATYKQYANELVSRINKARGIDKLTNAERQKRTDLVIMNSYGGERAKNRINELAKKAQKKVAKAPVKG